MDGITGATPGVTTAALSELHSGYGNADCGGCHGSVHLDGFTGAQCVTCHGTNGAPVRPPDHPDGDCASCHNSHPELAFASPNDCRGCHRYATVATCSPVETYDAVVVGAGAGGLAAASVLSRRGLNVAVLEQHHQVGGCMTNFIRGDYRFEASLHAYDGWGLSTLDALGIGDEVEVVRGPVMYRLAYPNLLLDVPADKTAYRNLLKTEFPHEAAHIDALFDGMTFTNIPAYAGMSLIEAIASHGIEDEKLIAVLTVLAGFLSATPDALPAESFIGMWDAYHSMGYHYFVGGSQAIVDALEQSIEQAGGTIKLHTRAAKIRIENDRVVGVETTDQACYDAPFVISNASLPVTYNELVGPEHLPAEAVTELAARTPASSSIAMIYLGVNRDYTGAFGGTHEIFVNTSFAVGADHAAAVRCLPEEVSYVISNYSVVDPTTAPPGKNVIVLTVDFMDYQCANQWRWGESYAAYNEYKRQLADILIRRAETHLPQLSEHIEVMEIGSPRTIEQYTLNPQGSWAGFAFAPELDPVHTGTIETPIEGLYVCGAWIGGAGQSVALGTGARAAGAVLANRREGTNASNR